LKFLGYYINMKCKKQLHWAKIEIKNVWEVHLDSSIWEKIVLAAEIHSKTYSWIVRYCVFQLTNQKKIIWTKRIMKIHDNYKNSEFKNKHRHMLCLYGDDEVLLRNSALILGISVSQLIRISIALYLSRLLKKQVSKEDLFWYGIKLFSSISNFRSLKNNFIAMDFHSHKPFSPNEYWGFG